MSEGYMQPGSPKPTHEQQEYREYELQVLVSAAVNVHVAYSTELYRATGKSHALAMKPEAPI